MSSCRCRTSATAKAFYERAFGWALTEFGPTYAATLTGDTDIGLQGDAAEATRAPLPVIEVDDLEAALDAVTRRRRHDRRGRSSPFPAGAASSSSIPAATRSPA